MSMHSTTVTVFALVPSWPECMFVMNACTRCLVGLDPVCSCWMLHKMLALLPAYLLTTCEPAFHAMLCRPCRVLCASRCVPGGECDFSPLLTRQQPDHLGWRASMVRS